MILLAPIDSAYYRVSLAISLGASRTLTSPYPLYRHIHNLVLLQLLATKTRPSCRIALLFDKVKESDCRGHNLNSFCLTMRDCSRWVYRGVLVYGAIIDTRHPYQLKDNITVLTPGK